MTNRISTLLLSIILIPVWACQDISEEILSELNSNSMTYTMPSEEEVHEGTWLQWPHNYGWDPIHEQRYELIWVKMAWELHKGEKVHIVVYNEVFKSELWTYLFDEGFDMNQIDMVVAKTDDVWARDTGPIYVFDENLIPNLIIAQ